MIFFNSVTKRTSYFCLARKLIWPLWSTHIFTQWGWLILFSLDFFFFFSLWAAPKLGKPTKLSLPNLWTSRIYSLRSKVPCWIWIRCIQLATHRNTFISPLILAMSTATRNSAQTSIYIILGQRFLETFTLLSHDNQDHTFLGDYIIPVLKQTRNLLHL